MYQTINICITGASGQIAYSFYPQLLRGYAFPGVHINLTLLDISQNQQKLKGVILQIHDCNYPLLQKVESGYNPLQMFKNADLVIFFGGFPRKPGMQRKELLIINRNIFIQQSKALSVAKPDVKCVVIANPANTNAYILSYYNPKLKKENITCLSRLDHNRAMSQIALKTQSKIQDIEGIMVFGNHSPTQYPGIKNIKLKGKPIAQYISQEWLQKTFITKVQNRGGQVLKVRQGSSVFSAASATIDHLRDWYCGTQEIVSMGVISDGSYGIPKGLYSSFPVKCKKNFKYQIVQGINLSDFCKNKIKISTNELNQEIDLAGIPNPKL